MIRLDRDNLKGYTISKANWSEVFTSSPKQARTLHLVPYSYQRSNIEGKQASRPPRSRAKQDTSRHILYTIIIISLTLKQTAKWMAKIYYKIQEYSHLTFARLTRVTRRRTFPTDAEYRYNLCLTEYSIHISLERNITEAVRVQHRCVHDQARTLPLKKYKTLWKAVVNVTIHLWYHPRTDLRYTLRHFRVPMLLSFRLFLISIWDHKRKW